MCTATGPQPNRRVHLRRPHPRGVDHHPRRQIHGLPGQLVGEVDGVSGGRGNTHAGEDARAVLGSRTCHRNDQSGVVDELSVVGQQRTVKPITTHGRGHRHRLFGADPARPGQNRGPGSGHGTQRVPGQKSGPHQCPLRPAHRRQQRHQLRHRPHQVRRGDRHQNAALHRTTASDANIAAGQVAQTAVGQLRTPAAGSEGKIVFFHQRHRQAATGGVECDTDTGDTATDDNDVDRCARAERSQISLPTVGVEGAGITHRESLTGTGIRSMCGRVRCQAHRSPGWAPQSGRTGWWTG